MSARRPTLLSTYRLPTDSTLYLGDEEVAAYLNGHAALWHPASLILALDRMSRESLPPQALLAWIPPLIPIARPLVSPRTARRSCRARWRA